MGHLYCTTRIEENKLKFEIMYITNDNSLEYLWGCDIADKCDLIDIHRLTHLFEKFSEDAYKYSMLYSAPRKNEKSRWLFISDIVDDIFKYYFKEDCCSRCFHYDWEPSDRKSKYILSNKFEEELKEKRKVFKQWKMS